MEFVYAVGLLDGIDIFMTRSGMPILKFYLHTKDSKIFCEYPLKKGFSYNLYNKLLNLRWRKAFIKGSIRNNGSDNIRIFVKNMLLFESNNSNNKKNGFSYVFYLINKGKGYIPYVKKDNKLYIQRFYKSKYSGQDKKVENIYIPTDIKVPYEGEMEKIYIKGILKNGIIFTEEIGVSGA